MYIELIKCDSCFISLYPLTFSFRTRVIGSAYLIHIRMKTEDKMPSCIAFQNSISNYYKVDRHISWMNHNYKEFEKNWEKYKELLII